MPPRSPAALLGIGRARFLLALLLASAAGSTQADICRTAPTASGAANGGTWADAMTLPAALAANTCTEIWLQQGLYRAGPARSDAFNIPRPLHLYGGFTGGETMRSQRGSNSRLTVLSGDIDGDDTVDANGITANASDIAGSNSYHVLRFGTSTAFTPANTVIDGLTITGGQANGSIPDHMGAGLLCQALGAGRACSPRIANVTFSGNLATNTGGGMSVSAKSNAESSPEITHSTFSGNQALYGGGLAVDVIPNNDATTGSPSIAHSTFSGNAAGRGGAVYVAQTVAASVEHVTFANNTASTYGGALHAQHGAQASVAASVFWGNTASSGGSQISLANTTDGNGTTGTGSDVGSLTGNIVQGGCGGVSSIQNATACTGSPGTGDPLLGSLTDSGGPTWTMLPAATSPTLNAATCSAGQTDQRGAARPTGANACDIGAVELQTTSPDSPMNGTASNDQVRQVTLSWQAAARAVYYVVARGGVEVCRTSATTCVVTGLGDGQFYQFSLGAFNEAGHAVAPQIPGGTLMLPGQSASFTTPGGEVRQATLSWTAPASGGAVARYIVTDTGTSTVVCDEPASSTGCVVGSLANGTAYHFALVARNAAGDGSARTADATTADLPGAPQNVAATPGDGSIRIAWSPPASDGGSAIIGYAVTIDGAPTACTASPCTLSGLTNGTAHVFIVTATNAAGTTPAGAVHATPAMLSTANVALPGSAGNAQVDIGGNPPGCVLSAPVTIDSNAPAGAPAGTTHPLGVLRFTASGCAGATLAVRVSYPAGRLAGLQPYKYGPPQAGEPAAWFAHGAISGDSVTYTVQDDGTGDNDTATPGVIADPFMPLALAAGAAAIPTLSQWALLLLGVLTAGLGAQTVRRRPR